jgi:hypothetical protein
MSYIPSSDKQRIVYERRVAIERSMMDSFLDKLKKPTANINEDSEPARGGSLSRDVQSTGLWWHITATQGEFGKP